MQMPHYFFLLLGFCVRADPEDVFDALLHKRIYKSNWSLKEVIEFFNQNTGKMFDPELVRIFMDNISDFLEIIEKYHQT